MPFRKVLIANRGEIAVRIARTCRAMGILTAAVYSEADAGALHVREADEALPIGPAEVTRSYLDIDALVGAARKSGADALHPGYGFLSQSGDFADAVSRAGVVFIGPPGDVHRRMGDKRGARRLMAAHGVPVLPGYDGEDQGDGTLAAEAERIGWPVILKPSRGGGGKGMRVVSRAPDFQGALLASRREALAAFGDDAMVLEGFVARSRHVEVQVLADGQGNVAHLGERECSIQRRHQKVIEETPSPALDPASRASLWAAGVSAAKAASYVNAGTVEFLLDPSGRFYFLEMNTRLQVEHPVTEAVTGLDLVRLQIEIAAGGSPPAQSDVTLRGHALECRVYAEDPGRGDLPSTGSVLHLVPPEGPGVRFDSGVAVGSEVGIHYDPMLAKVVAWGRDRGEAVARMRASLERMVLLGVVTNLRQLQRILAHPAFQAGALHTGFLDEHLSAADETPPLPPEAIAAALGAVAGRPAAPRGGASRAADPWSTAGPWRLA
jgi:3-methylcrotonyl-CoA carboxylase alpha subunit